MASLTIRSKKTLECEDCNATMERTGVNTVLKGTPLAYLETTIEQLDSLITSELLTMYARHRETEHKK